MKILFNNGRLKIYPSCELSYSNIFQGGGSRLISKSI